MSDGRTSKAQARVAKPKPLSKKANLDRVRAEYRAEQFVRAQMPAMPLAAFGDYLRTGSR